MIRWGLFVVQGGTTEEMLDFIEGYRKSALVICQLSDVLWPMGMDYKPSVFFCFSDQLCSPQLRVWVRRPVRSGIYPKYHWSNSSTTKTRHLSKP
jgi:hypothetical protein